MCLDTMYYLLDKLATLLERFISETLANLSKAGTLMRRVPN